MREVQFSDNILLTGYLKYEDGSFDHEFGTQVEGQYEVEDLHIILYVDGIDYDMTDSFKHHYPSTFESFEVEFVRRLING